MYYEYEYYVNDGENLEKNKNQIEDIKGLDKGYRKTKKVLNKEYNGKMYKTVTIEIYLSGDTGSKIRHAITGRYMEHFIGSKDEDLYFKAHVDLSIAGNSQGSTFYSSPEEYDKHNYTTIPARIKQNWYQKRATALK